MEAPPMGYEPSQVRREEEKVHPLGEPKGAGVWEDSDPEHEALSNHVEEKISIFTLNQLERSCWQH